MSLTASAQRDVILATAALPIIKAFSGKCVIEGLGVQAHRNDLVEVMKKDFRKWRKAAEGLVGDEGLESPGTAKE
jgi:hypothetical protein